MDFLLDALAEAAKQRGEYFLRRANAAREIGDMEEFRILNRLAEAHFCYAKIVSETLS